MKKLLLTAAISGLMVTAASAEKYKSSVSGCPTPEKIAIAIEKHKGDDKGRSFSEVIDRIQWWILDTKRNPAPKKLKDANVNITEHSDDLRFDCYYEDGTYAVMTVKVKK